MKNSFHYFLKPALQFSMTGFINGVVRNKPVIRGSIRRYPILLLVIMLIFSFSSILCMSGTSSGDYSGKILYPGNSTTAIVKAGESFDVWFDAKSGQKVHSVVLKGPYNTVPIGSGSITSLAGSWQYDPVSENRYNRQITITVPADTPEERYDLILNTSEGEAISRRSVKVVREYKTNYKIFLVSDSHYGQRGTEVMVPNKHTVFVEMANIINPDIVVNGGDVVYYHSDSVRLQERMDLFYHGLQYHFFKYGNSRFMIFNNGWLGYDWQWQYDRAADWLNGEGSKGSLNVVLAHISRTEFMDSFARDNDIGLYLLGHNHHLGDRNPYMLDERLVGYVLCSCSPGIPGIHVISGGRQ